MSLESFSFNNYHLVGNHLVNWYQRAIGALQEVNWEKWSFSKVMPSKTPLLAMLQVTPHTNFLSRQRAIWKIVMNQGSSISNIPTTMWFKIPPKLPPRLTSKLWQNFTMWTTQNGVQHTRNAARMTVTTTSRWRSRSMMTRVFSSWLGLRKRSELSPS